MIAEQDLTRFRVETEVPSEQLSLVGVFADQAAVALQNAMLHRSNEQRLEELTMAKSEVEELNRILADRIAQTSAELAEVKEHVLRDLDQAPLKYSYSNIIGKSRRMRDVFHLLDKVTESDVPVLILSARNESRCGQPQQRPAHAWQLLTQHQKRHQH